MAPAAPLRGTGLSFHGRDAPRATGRQRVMQQQAVMRVRFMAFRLAPGGRACKQRDQRRRRRDSRQAISSPPAMMIAAPAMLAPSGRMPKTAMSKSAAQTSVR